MKKNYSLSLLTSMILSGGAFAQWCVPTTATPYNTNMPGITNFTCNTINRTSADLENYPSNSYVLASNTTSLNAGSTYTVSISYTIDASICPDMNLRVWIDFNQDGQLDDPGETVITANNQTSLTYTGSFTVPSSATAGSTRLRVTAKMTPNGGHTAPTPCDIPADPIGYHGEIEDYNVTIMNPNGINAPMANISMMEAMPNPGTSENTVIHYSLADASPVQLTVTNLAGQTTIAVSEDLQTAGDHYLHLTGEDTGIPSGIYFVSLVAGTERQTMRIVILNNE